MGGFFKSHEHNLENDTTMMYGDYTFSPVPLVSINKTIEKTADGQAIGTLFNLSLEGSLVPGATGVNGIISITEEQDRLMAAFAASGQGYEFKISCGDADFIVCYPRINSINFESGPWVDVARYSIDLEYDRDFAEDIGAPWNDDHKSGSGVREPLVSSASENWSIEPGENSHFHFIIDPSGKPPFIEHAPPSFTVTHNVSAVGKPLIISGVISEGGHAWQQASGYVVPRLGFDQERVAKNGAICFDSHGKIIASNQTRTVNFGELEGNYEVTETWNVFPSSVWSSGINSLGASDIWEVNIESSLETSLATVSIQGTITGQATGVFCKPGTDTFLEGTSKYENAKRYLDIAIGALPQQDWDGENPSQEGEGNIFWSRAQHFASGITIRPINATPISRAIGHNPSQGTITYAYRFDDRPGACIEGARTCDIAITDTNATDVFAELAVLGRATGPVLQDIGTVTSKKREVTLDAVMIVNNEGIDPWRCLTTTSLGSPGPPGATGQAPRAAAEAILLTFRPDTYPGGDLIIFKNIDTESWNPISGKYTRQMGWIYSTCGSC